MIVEIDKNAGFCFGVADAIKAAEKNVNNKLYCLGDIVHNDLEIKRLQKKGVEFINHEKFKKLKNKTILIRAHGEPPKTFETAKQNNLNLIDATCPIVKKLQQRVESAYKNGRVGEQIVIFGKKGHAEAIGLLGYTNNSAIIVEGENDLENIDFEKPVTVFSQTTKSNTEYEKIVDLIRKNIEKSNNKHELRYNKTTCKQVAFRDVDLKDFAKKHDVIIFVSGKKSSNGKMLFEVCKSVNKKSFHISDISEIKQEWFKNAESVGISGATSTPYTQLEQVKTLLLK